MANTNLSILLIIGARGGSKGVKGKNIRPICGKPLIAYTIATALAWGKAKHVIVSTESGEIAQVAKKYGAEVPFMRPHEMATDTAPKGPALRYTLEQCEQLYRETYDLIVDLDVTAPIRTPQDLDKCLDIFNEKQPDTLFSVVKAQKNPYFNMVERKKDGRTALVIEPTGERVIRRQDAPEVYAMNASIYFYKRSHLLSSENPSPFSRNNEIYVMEDIAGIDVDREIDFLFIEYLIKEGIVTL